ncbi:MAG: hypothetical protein ACYS9X_30835, partial [Planctomycetota bacterium]
DTRAIVAEAGARAVVIVHQDTPLFVSDTRVSPAGADEVRMLSIFGDKVSVVDAGGRTVVVREEPCCLSERLDELAAIGATRLRVDFVWRAYSPQDARDRWRALRE